LILRINCFAILGDKMENKLRKANFTENVYYNCLKNKTRRQKEVNLKVKKVNENIRWK
jgi:hypothetical protein